MSDNANKVQKNGIRVQLEMSRMRQTPDTSFANVMIEGGKRAFNTAATAAGVAAPFVPGGAIVSQAITGLGRVKSAATGSTSPNATQMTLGGPTTGGSTLGAGGLGGGSALGGGAGANGALGGALGNSGVSADVMANKEIMDLNFSRNMQFLFLQQELQQESREFQTLSNVIKLRHDTAKNTISNVRG